MRTNYKSKYDDDDAYKNVCGLSVLRCFKGKRSKENQIKKATQHSIR